MEIVICEDEQYWVDELKAAVYRWAEKRNISVQCPCFSAPQDLVQHLTTDTNTDVMLLDISLGEKVIDGITLAKHIRKMGNKLPIIFVTADSLRATDGYLVDATGFIGKPIDEKRLELFLDRAIKQKEKDKIIRIPTSNGVTAIPQSDITYVEVLDHTIIYHTAITDICHRGTFTDALSNLGDEAFIQIHRAFIIAKDKIFHIKARYPYSVVLLHGTKTIDLPVSRKYIGKLLEMFSEDVWEKML